MLLHLDSKLKSFSLSEEKLKRTGIGLQPKSSQNKPANLVPINWLPQEILAYIIEIGWEQEEEEKKKWMARAEVEGCAARVRDFGPDGLIPNHDSDALIDYLYQARREISFGILCSWVCKKWRRVALAMPTLWSKINIRDHPPYERALEYAKRTKTTPLSVHINLLKHFSDPSNLDYALDRTLEIISPEVHRVTSLVVEVPFQAGLLRILHAFFRFRRPPPLERFQVMSYEYFNIGIDSETPTDRIFPQGQLLGNIRHLDLDNVDISWNRVRFRNLDSLRVANLGGPTLLAMHHVCAIIGACPRLERYGISPCALCNLL
ncbi:hypothetical protein FRC03_005220 [Tulasnella sp. 419]|nr:hypothetical protein FRC03_005220 [Tulasnella sp. 419]